MWARDLGLKKAIQKGAKFDLQHQQPLQALGAMMNEHDKSYSGQSAKRKRPSGSPASSRKRP